MTVFRRKARLSGILCLLIVAEGFVPYQIHRLSRHAIASSGVDVVSSPPDSSASVQASEEVDLLTSLNVRAEERYEETCVEQLALEERTTRVLRCPLGELLEQDLWEDAKNAMNEWSRSSSPQAAVKAESLFNRLQSEMDSTNNDETLCLEASDYAGVVSALATSDQFNCGARAEKILSTMERRIRPDKKTLKGVLSAWDRQGDLRKVGTIFNRIREDARMEVCREDYMAILEAYARRGAALEAEKTLQLLSEDGLEPDIDSWNCILNAWAKSSSDSAAERAEHILVALQKKFDDGTSSVQPDARSFSAVATAWAKSGKESALEKTVSWLENAKERFLAGEIHHYNAVLDALAVSKDKNAAHLAQELLNAMGKEGVVNTVSCNTVIKAWQLSGHEDAAAKAEAILERMEIMARDENLSLAVAPDTFTFTEVITCYGNSKKAGSKAVELFGRMVASCQEGNSMAKPNTVTLNAVLDRLAKSGEEGAAEKAWELLTKYSDSDEGCLDQIHPDAISYTCVIDAFARSPEPDAAQRAEEIFKLMQTKLGKEIGDKATIGAFNALLKCWIESGQKGCERRVESMVEQLEEHYKNGKSELRPNVVSYSIVMNGWATSQNYDDETALAKTEGAFNEVMKSFEGGNEAARPNCFIYVSLLTAMYRKPNPELAERADFLVRRMYEKYQAGNRSLKPTTKAITLVMDIWSKSGAREAGEKAEALLKWMVDVYLQGYDEELRPTAVSFTSAINAWARTRTFGKSKRAKELLDFMLQLRAEGKVDVVPNIITYTAVLNACAYTVGDDTEKIQSFQVATDIFKELCLSSDYPPNHVTYGALFSACRNLLPKGHPARSRSIQSIFKRCCLDGQVSEFVVSRVRSAVTKDELTSLFENAKFDGTGQINVALLPSEWTRNVKEDDRSRGKRPKP